MSLQETCVMYVQWSHKSLLATTSALSAEQFVAQPGPTSPAMGWHLFHMTRWADRLQSSFGPHVSAGIADACYPDEVWVQDRLAGRWGLDPKRLGFLETGAGMGIEETGAVVAVSQERLMDYAKQVFALADQTCAGLTPAEFVQNRRSILPRFQLTPTGALLYQSEKEGDVASDVIFHISHAGRHLGMIEALRGAMFALSGTASV